MALTIERTPVAYSSAHDDLVFIAYEDVKAIDPVTYVSYKYLADIYINGVLVTSEKAFPHPVTKRGIFNIGSIVRNYVSANLNFTTGQINAQEFGNQEFHAKVIVKFGEEYGGVLYTNIVVDSERKFYNHYNGRMKGRYTILNDYADKFATSCPLTKKLLRTSRFHFIPYFNTATGVVPVIVTTYNSSGVLILTWDISITMTKGFAIQQFNVAPVTLNEINIDIITSDVSYYTVQVQDVDDNLSQLYTFIIYCEPTYTTSTLHFLNQFGGYESFDFPKLSRSSIDITRKVYGTIKQNESGDTYVGVVCNDVAVTYGVNFTEKGILNTDNLTQDEYKFLSQLILSPKIFIEEDGFLVPVKIDASTYDFRKTVNDRVFNLTVQVLYMEVLNAQYL